MNNNKKNLFLLFSHKLTHSQKSELELDFGICEFLYLPNSLQELWSNIPPRVENLNSILKPFKNLIKIELNPGDFVLVQGDFGATHIMVNWCNEHQFIPLYSTTLRHHQEQELPDGSLKIIKTYKHCRFRKFEK